MQRYLFHGSISPLFQIHLVFAMVLTGIAFLHFILGHLRDNWGGIPGHMPGIFRRGHFLRKGILPITKANKFKYDSIISALDLNVLLLL